MRQASPDHQGRDLAGKRAAPVDTAQLPTLRQAIDAYIDSRTNTLSPATLRGYDIVKRNRFKGIMDTHLEQLEDTDLIAAVNTEATLCSAKTLKNAWGLIRPALKMATGRKPPDVTLPQVVPQERVFLDATEIQIFRAAVRGNRYEIPFLLALSSLRMSELMALRWEDVDLKHKRIRVAGAAVPGRDHKMVHKKETKNRTSNRYVPILMDQLQKALEAACARRTTPGAARFPGVFLLSQWLHSSLPCSTNGTVVLLFDGKIPPRKEKMLTKMLTPSPPASLRKVAFLPPKNF